MRTFYSIVAAALLLGCSDDRSQTTAPRLSGAVVGGSLDRNGGGNDDKDDDHGDHGGRRLVVTLLTGADENPPRDTPASGRVALRLSKDGTAMEYVLDVKDITNITQAHIHNAAKGVNGPIVVWLFPSVKSTTALPGGGGPVDRLVIEGRFTAADFRGPLAGKTMADFIALIGAGATYGNVHTDDGVAPPNTGAGDFPGGEIRGQLDKNGK